MKILGLVWNLEMLSGCKTICNNLCENYSKKLEIFTGLWFPCPILGKERCEVSVPTLLCQQQLRVITPTKHPENFTDGILLLVFSFPMDPGISCYKTSTCLVFRRFSLPLNFFGHVIQFSFSLQMWYFSSKGLCMFMDLQEDLSVSE